MVIPEGALVRCKVQGLGGRKVEASPPRFRWWFSLSENTEGPRKVKPPRVTVEAEKHSRDVRARAR